MEREIREPTDEELWLSLIGIFESGDPYFAEGHDQIYEWEPGGDQQSTDGAQQDEAGHMEGRSGAWRGVLGPDRHKPDGAIHGIS